MSAPLIVIGGQIEDWGIIPSFLDTADPRPAKQQIAEHYIAGWVPFEGFSFDPVKLVLTYPEDPPMEPVSILIFRSEQLLIYDSAWVVILQSDGTWEASRLD